ncbi:MAG: hypothetical protein ACPLXS_03560 [Candidatus Micrarchaeales archaeon]
MEVRIKIWDLVYVFILAILFILYFYFIFKMGIVDAIFTTLLISIFFFFIPIFVRVADKEQNVPEQ